jgi:hypothetical protein
MLSGLPLLLATLVLGQSPPLPTVPPEKFLAPIKAVKAPEAARLRILLVVDTDDRLGITWGRDGDNVKTVLESAVKKQQLGDRCTLEVFAGQQVTPGRILAYYRDLASEPGESLVFYYSGHGGLHYTKGHYLALTHGWLYRSDLLTAMAAKKPQLLVVLTDCCANWYGGAARAEPAGVMVVANANKTIAYRQDPVQRQEPPGVTTLSFERKPIAQREPQRGENDAPALPQRQEPLDVKVEPANRGKPYNFAPARREEPAGAVVLPGGVRAGPMESYAGVVSVADITSTCDGRVFRDLFLRHAGVVDINGCTQGELSSGKLEWGGSLFTNALLSLMRNVEADFDFNKNGVTEWSEFFPYLREGTFVAGQRVPRGKVRQIPEAHKLAAPILP